MAEGPITLEFPKARAKPMDLYVGMNKTEKARAVELEADAESGADRGVVV